MTEFVADKEHPVSISADDVQLDGTLYIPSKAKGVVIFAHGSGSSRHSPRNQAIAQLLQQSKFATLLFDLLTPQEDEIDEKTKKFRFDVGFLGNRLLTATSWLLANPAFHTLPIGYFGASTGAAAALIAAEQEHERIQAVVSRGGRPDLAGKALKHVEAPTLLIVGGNDETVLELNQQALAELHCIKQLTVIPGATHLFEEPGKLTEVARLADEWFKQHLK